MDNSKPYQIYENESLRNASFCVKNNDLIEAEKIYKSLLDNGSKKIQVFLELSTIYLKNRKYEEAYELLFKSLKYHYEDSRIYQMLGNISKLLSNNKLAIKYFNIAIEYDPSNYQAYNNLGVIYHDLGDFRNSFDCLSKATELNKFYPEAFFNLANTFRSVKEYKSAIYFYKESLDINPNYAKSLNNMGVCYHKLGDYLMAIKIYNKLKSINPYDANCKWNLAISQLTLLNYHDGLINYEYRLSTIHKNKLHYIPITRMFAGEDLFSLKHLLVISEQGLGDTIQYMRYIQVLSVQGIEVSFIAQDKLHGLIKSSNIHQTPMSPSNTKMLDKANWISLISIPRFLGVSPSKPIINDQYIFVDPSLNEKWCNIFSSEPKPIIAINWQGNPEMEKEDYPGRSIPLKLFLPLFNLKKFSIISIQKGYGSEQIDQLSMRKNFANSQNYVDEVFSFDEIAAVINNCDLVISNDTSIAHLTGALGKPIWLLLNSTPYWTWGAKGTTSFWYKSMKIFRQKIKNNWTDIIDEVCSELIKSY